MSYIALSINTHDSIWASGETEEEAKTLLWEKVHEYLVKRQAPETAEFSAEQLEEYFGVRIINAEEKWGYL